MTKKSADDSLFLLKPTNAQLYCTTVFLEIIYTPTCFDISLSLSGSFNLCLARLHKFLKLKLLRLEFHKTIKIQGDSKR